MATDQAIDLSSTDLFDIQRTMRAMRRLKPDPVPDALITEILEAATCAPNGGNSQKWRFLVVKDPVVKKKVQHYYKRAYDEVQKPRHDAYAPKEPGPALDQHHRNEASIEYLTDHFHEAPVWIVACAADANSDSAATGASVFPTGGYANPTLTIVALALRLAEELQREMSDRGHPSRGG